MKLLARRRRAPPLPLQGYQAGEQLGRGARTGEAQRAAAGTGSPGPPPGSPPGAGDPTGVGSDAGAVPPEARSPALLTSSAAASASLPGPASRVPGQAAGGHTAASAAGNVALLAGMVQPAVRGSEAGAALGGRLISVGRMLGEQEAQVGAWRSAVGLGLAFLSPFSPSFPCLLPPPCAQPAAAETWASAALPARLPAGDAPQARQHAGASPAGTAAGGMGQ